MEKNKLEQLNIYIGINCLVNGQQMAWSYVIIDSDGVEHSCNEGFTPAKSTNSLVMAADKCFMDISFFLGFIFASNEVEEIVIHCNFPAIKHLYQGTIYASEELYPNVSFIKNQIGSLKPTAKVTFVTPSGSKLGEELAMVHADRAARLCIYNEKLMGWYDYTFADFTRMALDKDAFLKFVKINKFDKFRAYRDAESKKKMAFINRIVKMETKTKIQATLQFLDGF
jgi:hypothetical protein